MEFNTGDRVIWRDRIGTIVYKRMAPPGYFEVEAYSVRLDDVQKRPGYAGTMCNAAEVFSADRKEDL